MCGIAGQVSWNGNLDFPTVEGLGSALHHRGPDGAGLWCSPDGGAALAHRRLAVRDLSDAAAQPMVTPDGRAALVYNGELYNSEALRRELVASGYTFRSTGDTEVLLAAWRHWGEACVERLEGMFAFAIYDADRRRLLLARDRAGQKPLYFHQDGSGLWFCSELTPLLRATVPARRLDLPTFEYYLAYGQCPGDRTLVRNVHKVPPGHRLVLDARHPTPMLERYWSLPRCTGEITDLESATDRLDERLSDAVRRTLVSDVPVGVLLSGGIDSSLVAAMAVRHAGGPVHTFTVAFPGTGRFDEAPRARKVAAVLGTQHTELRADAALLDDLPGFLERFDDPVGTDAILPMYALSRLVRTRVTVALGGDGGDELFGGYPHQRLLQRKLRLQARVPRCVRAPVVRSLLRVLPIGTRGRTHLAGLAGGRTGALASGGLFLDQTARRRLLTADALGALEPGACERARAAAAEDAQDPIDAATRIDFRTTLPESFLLKVDRASMAASLEVRAPFLDEGLVEFAFGPLSPALKVGPQGAKRVPARLAERLLGTAIDTSRKQGFTVPMAHWLDVGHGAAIRDALDTLPRILVRPEAIRALLRSPRPHPARANRIFALLAFACWRRALGVEP